MKEQIDLKTKKEREKILIDICEKNHKILEKNTK
jgi:hypothetical protein